MPPHPSRDLYIGSKSDTPMPSVATLSYPLNAECATATAGNSLDVIDSSTVDNKSILISDAAPDAKVDANVLISTKTVTHESENVAMLKAEIERLKSDLDRLKISERELENDARLHKAFYHQQLSTLERSVQKEKSLERALSQCKQTASDLYDTAVYWKDQYTNLKHHLSQPIDTFFVASEEKELRKVGSKNPGLFHYHYHVHNYRD
jgi:G3E family GTPase